MVSIYCHGMIIWPPGHLQFASIKLLGASADDPLHLQFALTLNYLVKYLPCLLILPFQIRSCLATWQGILVCRCILFLLRIVWMHLILVYFFVIDLLLLSCMLNMQEVKTTVMYIQCKQTYKEEYLVYLLILPTG